MKRDFTVKGNKYSVVASNNSGWKWQVIGYSDYYKSWVLHDTYGNTIAECKEKTIDNIRYVEELEKSI